MYEIWHGYGWKGKWIGTPRISTVVGGEHRLFTRSGRRRRLGAGGRCCRLPSFSRSSSASSSSLVRSVLELLLRTVAVLQMACMVALTTVIWMLVTLVCVFSLLHQSSHPPLSTHAHELKNEGDHARIKVGRRKKFRSHTGFQLQSRVISPTDHELTNIYPTPHLYYWY